LYGTFAIGSPSVVFGSGSLYSDGSVASCSTFSSGSFFGFRSTTRTTAGIPFLLKLWRCSTPALSFFSPRSGMWRTSPGISTSGSPRFALRVEFFGWFQSVSQRKPFSCAIDRTDSPCFTV
jgi:hypothetical protein